MAAAKKIISSPSFRRCTEFHGHQCPGLAIGYRAARLAMDMLDVGQLEDEKLVAVVENDSCAVDAVQVLTCCTFGKGNLIFNDHGKQALTLGDRGTGKAVRVVLRNGALPSNLEHQALFEKIRTGSASQMERERFQTLHRERTWKVLEMDVDTLFRIERCHFEFPEKARIMLSEPCALCGEPTMITRLEESPNGFLCPACRKNIVKSPSCGSEPRTFAIRSIGCIRTPFKSLDECPHQGRLARVEGDVVLDDDVIPALKDVEECTHLILLSFYHLADRQKLQTRTPHGPEIHGTFATRSPHRPNPIAMHAVELLGIDGNRLRVRGVDCLNGTLLIDIKPYSARLDAIPEAIIGWERTT